MKLKEIGNRNVKISLVNKSAAAHLKKGNSKELAINHRELWEDLWT